MDSVSMSGYGTIDPKPYKITGIMLLVLGLLGMIFPKFASGVVAYLTGFILLIGGALFFVVGFKGGKGAIGAILLGILFLILGILIFVYPAHSLAAMTLILGIFFIVIGIASLLLGYGLHPVSGWQAPVVTGVLSFVLGILIFIGWPGNSEWLIGLFVGIDLFFQGISLMVLGYYAS